MQAVCVSLLMLMTLGTLAQAQTIPSGEAAEHPLAPQPAMPGTSAASDSKYDWNRVRELAHDEEINVWSSRNRHVRCLFTGATEDLLFCEPAYRHWNGSGGAYRFNRVDVDKIRLEQGESKFRATVGTMATVGVVGGALATNTKNGGERAVGAVAGGLAGLMAGVIVGVPIAIFVPGHLVYERPHTGSRPRATAQLGSGDANRQRVQSANSGTVKDTAVQ